MQPSMKLGTVDYSSSYFKYRNPVPIRGVPTHKALQRLKKELQANANSIDTRLCGGDHVCLYFVLLDEECSKIPLTHLFMPPACLVPLEIP